MVCIVVLRPARSSDQLVFSRGSLHAWTISAGEGSGLRMRFSKKSSRREIDARVSCESSRGRRVDHVRHVGDGGISFHIYSIADMSRQQEFPC